MKQRKRKPVNKPVLAYSAKAEGVPFYSATVNTAGMTEPEKKGLFHALDELAKLAFTKIKK